MFSFRFCLYVDKKYSLTFLLLFVLARKAISFSKIYFIRDMSLSVNSFTTFWLHEKLHPWSIIYFNFISFFLLFEFLSYLLRQDSCVTGWGFENIFHFKGLEPRWLDFDGRADLWLRGQVQSWQKKTGARHHGSVFFS